jgi:diguanylate cyclase (GGDEF)-like protein
MIIPVFQAKLTRKNYYAVVILILSAVLSAWGIIFKGQPAFTENLPDILKGSSFLSILFVLGYLGWTIAGIINKINHKALFMHNMATTDALTGLINRREFNRRISEEFSRAKRHKLNLCVALFDIDFFKKINDSYGHNAGDAILKELGKLISSNTRSCDIAARYGGEEFALILPETSQTDAYELMDRLRSLVEKEIFYKKIKPIKATVSVGVAQMESNDKNPLEFCERADKALYKAKNKGRNRVEKAFSEIMTLNVRSKAV